MRECIGTSRFFAPKSRAEGFRVPHGRRAANRKRRGSRQIAGPAAEAKRRQAEKKAGAPESACRVSDNWSHSLISSCTHFRSVPKGIFMINTLFFDLLCWVRGLDAIWLVHWSYSPFLDFANVLEMLVHGVHIFLFPPWRKIYMERGRFGGPEMHFRFAGSTLDFFFQDQHPVSLKLPASSARPEPPILSGCRIREHMISLPSLLYCIGSLGTVLFIFSCSLSVIIV